MPRNKLTVPHQPSANTVPKMPLNPQLKMHDGVQINLIAPQGTIISLTSDKLESWFAAIERRNPQTPISSTDIVNNPYLARVFISRFGFKNPNEILMYLNSPAGAHLRAIIAEELLEMAELENFEHALADENEWRYHLKHALLFLGLLYEEEAYAKHVEMIKQIILDQQKQAQATHDKSKKQTEYDAALQQQQILNEQLQAFYAAYGALDSKLSQKMQESEQLEKELTTLEQEKIALEKEAILFDSALEEMDLIIQEGSKQADPKTYFESHIAKLKQTMELEIDDINELIANNKDSEAMELLKIHQAHHAQVAGLNNIFDVLKGDKYFVDNEGNPVETVQKAQLIINKSNKIVKDQDGKYYVISAGEDLESIKQSANAHERLNLAHRHYQKDLAENNTIHIFVAQNKSSKKEHHSKRYEAALNRSTQLQTEIVVLSTQMMRIQTDHQQNLMANMQQNIALKAPNNSTPMAVAPVPRPEPTTSASPKKQHSAMTLFPSAEHNAGKTLQLAFKLMLHDRTPRAIDAFKARLNDQHNPDLRLLSTINQDLDSIRALPAITPVPETTVKNLLQNLARFGTQGKNPTYTTPTPFGITPKLDPYK